MRPASALALALASLVSLAAACDEPRPSAAAPRGSSSALPVAPPHSEGAGADALGPSTQAGAPTGAQRTPPPTPSGRPARPVPPPAPTAL